MKMELTAAQKTRLLQLARETLESHFHHKKYHSWQDDPVLSILKSVQTGAFVTLTRTGELRGCIGMTESDDPLPAVIEEMAIAAATQDPRFGSVNAEELPVIEIEISVLTPPESIAAIDQIEIGRHGLIIVDGWQRGLLLPQVPVEWNWDRETFLGYTCAKAGLPKNAWKNPSTQIYWFEAIVFSEHSSAD